MCVIAWAWQDLHHTDLVAKRLKGASPLDEVTEVSKRVLMTCSSSAGGRTGALTAAVMVADSGPCSPLQQSTASATVQVTHAPVLASSPSVPNLLQPAEKVEGFENRQ